ncbi:MAG: hypothetical protein IJW48_00170 [Clostridia bacterium]|nr:hypothetical protein [Clostridia bacterium]
MSNKHSRSDIVRRVLYWIIMVSFIFSLIYVPLRAIFDIEYRENSEYKIMIFQTILGIIGINLPSFLTKKFMWKIPNAFIVIFTLFLWGAIFCGEVMKFYYRVNFWDDMLHLLSSMMLGVLGFSLIEILNNDRKHALVNLSPFFVAVFSVSFAVLIGVLWEFYEYIFDGILGLNMQKFAVEATVPGEKLTDLVGRAALSDTMMDLIVDFLGATVASVFGYISLKLKKGWLNAFKVEIFGNKSEDTPTPALFPEGTQDEAADEPVCDEASEDAADEAKEPLTMA